MQVIVNQSVSIPFTSAGLGIGLPGAGFSPIFLRAGVVTSVPSVVTEVGGGLYLATFTPNATGEWTMFVQGQIINFSVVVRDFYTMLRNLEDESLGSWQWNKVTGVMSLVRQDGTTLATFQVTDGSDSASRERVG